MPETNVVTGTVVNGATTAPVRNRYFYGKLLDARHLSMEQKYLIEHRRRMNRVGHGAGVLCGLEATVTADGRRIVLGPGVAIDGRGREIVVSEPVCIEHPTQPTDSCGKPIGDAVVDGKATLCLSYLECDIEPTRALVADCETHERCVPGAVRERSRLLVHEGAPDEPQGVTAAQCAAIFPNDPPEGFDRRAAACAVLTADCPGPEPDCVTLGTVTARPEEAITFQACEGRTTVYSNARLFDMLLCLAQHQEGGTPAVKPDTLHYVSGDAQNGTQDGILEEPVAVEVRDGAGKPLEGVPVTFRALGGGGGTAVGSGTFAIDGIIDSDDAGRAAASWRLGPVGPLFTLEATIAGGGRIAFHALAARDVPPPPPDSPKILQIWPPNAVTLTGASPERAAFLERPRIELTFDRPMTQTQLDKPDDWLRVWRLTPGPDKIRVARIPLARVPSGDVIVASTEIGTTVAWDLSGNVREPGWFLVQVHAEAGAPITAAAAPNELLDADFAGTGLEASVLDALWSVDQRDVPRDVLDDLITGTDTLEGSASSGDDMPGGRLHAWFELS